MYGYSILYAKLYSVGKRGGLKAGKGIVCEENLLGFVVPLFDRLAGRVRSANFAAFLVVQFHRERFIEPERYSKAVSNSHTEDSQPDNHADTGSAYFQPQFQFSYPIVRLRLHHVQQRYNAGSAKGWRVGCSLGVVSC